ncbi:MAG: hypothetical protein HFJ27_00765 [Clostridia bacterium]|nr:hypothetical protein [Clostridia bacterium]
MKKDHKKTIIIAAIIAIILIILIVGGVLFFTTDLFKTNQELFFKYFAQNMEVVEEYIQDPNKPTMDSIKSAPYILSSNVTFDLVSTDANIANQTTPPRNFSIEYTKNANPQSNRDYSEAKVRYLTKELFTAQYAHDGDLHVVNGINGANQVKVFNMYLGIENKNLKQLAQKLGIQDISNIPNQLGNVSIDDLISLNQEEKQYFQDFLVRIITSQIPKEKYYHTKGVDIEINTKPVKANTYGVTLTSEEYQNLIVAMLNAISQDDTILSIILQKIMKIDLQTDMTQDRLKEQIGQMLQDLNENKIQNGITVEVYEAEGKIVRTQIKFSDTDVYTIDFERANNSIRTLISLNNTYTIEAPNQEIQDTPPIIQDGYHVIEGSANLPTPPEAPAPQTITIKNIELAKQISGSQTNMIAILTYEIDDSVMKVSLQSKTEPNNTQGLTNNMVMIINDSATTYFTIKANSNYSSSSSVSVQELNETNSAVLNNRTTENISQLLNALKVQLQKIYEQQMQVANEVQQQEGNTGINQVNPSAPETNTITNIPNVVE